MRILKTALWIVTVCAVAFLVLRQAARHKEPAPDIVTSSPLVAMPESPSPGSVDLIRGGEESDEPWTSRTPAAKRVRRIFPDTSWMTPEPTLKVGDLIKLALFDDAVFEAKLSNVTRYPNGGIGMTAHLLGQTGTVYLSYHDGKLTASIETSSGADLSIETRNGVQYAVEIDRVNSDILEGAEPISPPVQDAIADAPAGSASVFPTVPGAPAGSTIVDVMFVYTPAAQSWAATNNGIVNIMNSAMQRANTAHTNSDTQVYLNLVHSEAVNYVEQGISTDLTNLTFTGGNYSAMDEVQSLRDQHSADLVCLLEKTDDAGGLGWLLNNEGGTPDYAFCIGRVQQASWTYTVVHEWGHNMGCSHSKTQSRQPWEPTDFRTYSAGWQWEDPYPPATYEGDYVGYCSIMTYQDFDNDGKYEYERVPHFSNPSISYQSQAESNPTGDAADGDNARTIREMKIVLADYRKALDLDYDGLPNEWELLYFGGETNANPAAVASNGVNTVREAYVAGLNPTNASSFFSVTNAASAAGGFVVRWIAASGRVYSVRGTTNLQESFQPLETNILWPQASWTDTVNRSENFYQVDVELE